MSAPVLIGVCLLGGLGALGRYLADLNITERFASRFPLDTLVVNLSGAFAIGIFAGAVSSADATRLIAIGFLGGYTTFSTWMLETGRLAAEGERRFVIANIVLSLVLGLGLAWGGLKLGETL